MAQSGWGDGTYGSSFWGGFLDQSVSPTGVIGTSSLGDVYAAGVSVIFPTGVSATVSVGNVVASIPVTVGVTGVSANTQISGGWGEAGWGEIPWGGPTLALPSIEVNLTGVSATSSVGSVSMTGTSVLTLTGVSATGALGNPLAAGGAIVTETGLTGTIGFGDEQVVATANVFPTGVSGTSALGDETIETDTGAPVTNVPTLTSSLGTAIGFTDVAATPSGNLLSLSVGSVSIAGNADVLLTNVSGTGNIGTMFIWGRIAPAPTAIWSEVAA